MASPTLLWVDGVWLLLLAFLYLVVYREYSLLRVRILLDERTVSDGPEIGSLVPRSARSAADRVHIFLFGDCAPCHDLAATLHRMPTELPIEISISDGLLPGSSSSLARTIKPTSFVTVLSGAEAEQRRLAFNVNTGPFGVVVRRDVVSAKGQLRSFDDLRWMASMQPERQLVAIDAHPNRA